MDISDTLQPNSDQLDAIELVSGPRDFTIKDVSRGNAEQPVNIHLHELDRPWRPGKSMRRVLAACWGTDATAYIGRRVRLYMDPSIMFGKEKVGGTRIAALSHPDEQKSIPLLISRGKSAMFTVQPLAQTEPVTEPWQAQWQAISNALTAAGYEGDGPALLTTAGQVIGAEWTHPNQITADQAQKVLAAVREDNNEEN